MSDIPNFLTRHGVTEVRDNIPAGHQVQAPSSPFVVLFRDELLDRLSSREQPAQAGEGER